MWLTRFKWLAWCLLYFVLRICGVIVFRYDFQVGRFQQSFIALVYSCSLMLVYFFTHSGHQDAYLEGAGVLYTNKLVMETFRYNLRFSSITFLLVYSVQIWRRNEIVKLFNDGLDLMEQLAGSNLDTKHLDVLTFCLFTSTFGFLYDATGIGNNLVEISVKAILPFYTKLIFGATWTLITSLAVRVVRILNAEIELIEPEAAGETLNRILRLHTRLYPLIQTLGSLSSVNSVVQLVTTFIGLATLVSLVLFQKRIGLKNSSQFNFVCRHTMESVVQDFTLDVNFYAEIVCNTLSFFPFVVQGVVGQLLIDESKRTALLLHDLSFRCRRPLKQTVCSYRDKCSKPDKVSVFQIEEFGLFLAHHRLKVTLLDMLVLNLEIVSMVT
jgi:7tm Chemosensory receptor